MLELYYDCTDRFVDRKDFEFVEMDTNSTYMPLTTPLESILKPGMEREFLESRNTTQRHLGCSKKSTKVQGLLLSTERPKSVGNLSRTHQGEL